MKLSIDWEKPFIEAGDILKMTTSALDDFYASATECNRMNLYFVLLNTLNRCGESREEAAHIHWLAAYYLFVPLTPPGSRELAEGHIRKAIELNSQEKYREFLLMIEKGN